AEKEFTGVERTWVEEVVLLHRIFCIVSVTEAFHITQISNFGLPKCFQRIGLTTLFSLSNANSGLLRRFQVSLSSPFCRSFIYFDS
ncbi:unnamed protein product, partial [Arabidopsis halleri]